MKLTDDEFWKDVRTNGGIFSRVVTSIQDAYPKAQHMTRQAVRQRCMKDDDAKKKLEDCEEESLDVAEIVCQKLLRNNKDPRHQFLVAKFILETKGKHRGYTKAVEINGEQRHTINFKD
jgi:dephospho-CoA kinase